MNPTDRAPGGAPAPRAAMKLIAVLDLMGGQAVHARRGQRDAYRPLDSRLCPGADPRALAQALYALHAFDALYVADLDAICGCGDNASLWRALRERIAPHELWLDAGVRTLAQARALADAGVVPVLGSETLAAAGELHGPGATRCVLSLDFRAGRLQAPAGLVAARAHWPAELIVMTLDRVGAAAGPDLDTFAQVRAHAGGRALYAAGGVRGPDDLRALAQVGAAGVLLATSLHDGSLSAAMLRAFQSGEDG